MKSSYMIWTARLLSLLLLAGIMILGILAYGYASDDHKVRVSKNNDTEFFTEQGANLLAIGSSGDERVDSLTIPEGNIFVYTSEIKEAETDFIMTGVEITADLPSGTNLEGKIRASKNAKEWTGWINMDLLIDDSVSQGKYFSENPVLFGEKMKYAQYTLTLTGDGNVSPVIYDVVLTHIDSTNRLEFITQGYEWLVDSVKSRETIDIVTREEWEADESIMNWDPEYSPVEQIVVHHTAGGTNAPVDSAAVVRGIYYFHSVEKDWGDIGYNFIIDHHGRIFEGRKGGLGAVGAHASGNNYGSVGIAIIGDYTESSPAQNSLKSLIELIEYVSYQTDLEMSGSHNINGNNIPVIAGHRDVNPTECPGDVLYSMLGDIRLAVEKGLTDLPEKLYTAELVNQSASEINLNTGDKNTISVVYKNTGNSVWLADDQSVKLVPVDPYPRNSGFGSSSWESAKIVGPVAMQSVMPGDEVQFDLELLGMETEGRFVEKFALVNSSSILENTVFEVVINNIKTEKNDIINDPDKEKDNHKIEDAVSQDGSDYAVEWVGQSDKVILYPGEEKSVWIEFKNTGVANWYREGNNSFRLGTDRPTDHASQLFVDGAGWISSNRIALEQKKVTPGETGRFKFTVKASAGEGTIREYFRPVVEGVSWLDDMGVYIEVETKAASYGVQWVDQSESPLVLQAGKKARIWVDLKNTGDVVWRRDGDNPVHLGTDRSLDRDSVFYSSGYWISENRAAEMKRSMVYPGDTVRFEIVLTAPENPGVYREYFRPVVEGVNWLDDLGMYWDIVVEK